MVYYQLFQLQYDRIKNKLSSGGRIEILEMVDNALYGIVLKIDNWYGSSITGSRIGRTKKIIM